MNDSSNRNSLIGINTELTSNVMHNSLRVLNSPCSVSTAAHVLENRLNYPSNTTNHGFLYSGNGFNKSVSTFSSCSVDSSFPNLSVSMGQNLIADYSQYHSCGSSPPPPALSPVSSSPTHANNNHNNQPSSPSPPIIVAEIRGPSSISSHSASEKSSHAKGASKIKSQHASQILNKPPNSSFPRVVNDHFMSSSSSSSSSTSSSSILNEASHAANGLPILEKISIVLGSPKRQVGENSAIRASNTDPPLKNDDIKLPKLVLENHIHLSNNRENCLEKLDDSLKANSHSVTEDTKSNILGEKSKVATKRKAPVRSKRRPKSRKIRGGSDSDFEPFSHSQADGSRGRADARALIRRVQQKVSIKKSLAAVTSDTPGGTSADIAMRRKYLESPFLCLCQAGKTVSSLMQTSNDFTKYTCIPSGSKVICSGATTAADNELIYMNSSFSAHIINPALRDLSIQQVNGNISTHNAMPISCPFNANLRGNETIKDDKHDACIESRSILAGIAYRPSGPLRVRDYQFPTSVNPKSLWICAFCGEDNNYTELGCLYGPYWITESDMKQLPSEIIYSPSNECQPSDTVTQPNSPTAPISRRARSIEKAIRSGVITSTTTRSAAAQGRPTVANTGVLRLVIKASNNAVNNQSLTRNLLNTCEVNNEASSGRHRVGSNGEVWFHFECVLWAPGTYINGNGVVGGLGEALQLALNANCSFCQRPGAILSCCNRGCNLSYHYQCANRAECHLNREQYILLCKKHHIYS
ncbi:hypothetical protein MN116_007529 [Schistosoma mekongi]|uniref:PHD-type domain-containing protein n=1 Tax=Schistosoma mekongi TaxID=38744 RepID=A0AAE2D2L0_SCHME|nr:hypothetical protein MN116_007529 [Schistosoma mekongi]